MGLKSAVYNQERFQIKSGLWWRVYGILFHKWWVILEVGHTKQYFFVFHKFWSTKSCHTWLHAFVYIFEIHFIWISQIFSLAGLTGWTILIFLKQRVQNRISFKLYLKLSGKVRGHITCCTQINNIHKTKFHPSLRIFQESKNTRQFFFGSIPKLYFVLHSVVILNSTIFCFSQISQNPEILQKEISGWFFMYC